ncbi:hypothetical protein [Maricaulis sp.]|jgi:hypothetical protein|uniref:hypothetical protein n=1 Tax=Maricaulis sp. TaxID=1486257 RepID=UPI0026097A86|nr:hypothetical protein [Maricaulis sp.]MDF1769837.1 hypothetical protein [Maricaulis sp.]
MARELLRVNPLIGSKSELITHDDEPDKVHVAWEQRVDHIVDENQQMEEMHSQAGADMRLAARVPLKVWMHLQEIGIANDPVALKRWLNDPDNRKHRVWKGNI